MVKYWWGLFSFITSKRPGYALLTAMIVLIVICLTVVWQYHYYSQQWLIEDRLARQFFREAVHNLANKK